MKLLSFIGPNQTRSWGVSAKEAVIDIPLLATGLGTHAPEDIESLFTSSDIGWLEALVGRASVEQVSNASVDTSKVRVLPPVSHPGKIVAVGRNYLDHAGEANVKLPKWPKLFPKFSSTIVGPGDEVIKPTMTNQLDFEVELAVVISKVTSHVSEDQAMDHVAGYTILNDISARDVQFTDEQITLGKNFDTFCPLGPVITTTDEMDDPFDIGLRLRLNGEVMQESSTKHLIFSVPFLVSFISYAMRLEPGDIISTGTPAGVGCFRNPPIWLAPGDKIESEVDGVGTLVNVVAQGEGEVPVRRSNR